MLASRLVRQGGRPWVCRKTIATPRASVRPRTRAFHASAPRKLSLDEAVLYVPHQVLETLHTAMPWYAAIPIAAFIFRGLLVTTIGSRVRANMSRYVALMPVRNALAASLRDRVMKKGMNKPHQAKKLFTAAFKKESAALDNRWSCSLKGQLGWTLLQLPIFLGNAEAIRRMGGFKTGLLGMVMHPSSAGDKETHLTDIAVNPWFQPSLADEGMLWFTDLTAADPTGVLPFVVSGLMITNILLQRPVDRNGLTQSRRQKILKNTLLVLALSIGPLGQTIPAGLLYYWVGSTSSVILWNLWLDRRYPIVAGMGPCARPYRKILEPPPTVKSPIKRARSPTRS